MKRLAVALVLLVGLTGCVQSRQLPPAPTAEELGVLDARVRDIQWQYLGFTPDSPQPAVTFLGYVDPEETTETYVECMVDAGFVDYDPFASGNGTADVNETLALFVCISERPLEPRYYNLFTTRQLEFLYDYYQESVIPCLRGAGIEIGTIPTREQFTTPLRGGGTYLWSPWQRSADISPQTFMSVSLHCPDYSFAMIRRTGE